MAKGEFDVIFWQLMALLFLICFFVLWATMPGIMEDYYNDGYATCQSVMIGGFRTTRVFP